MALRTCDEYNIPVHIVPCGLNYFSGHRFRGRVLLEYGKPYKIPDEIIELYKKDKREGCNQLLLKITDLLNTVVVSAPDYETLEAVYTIRKFYQPTNITLQASDYLELNRRFVNGFLQFKDEPRIQECYDKLRNYLDRLKLLGLKDRHIEEYSGVNRFLTLLRNYITKFIMMLVSLIFSGPILLLNTPILLIVRKWANKEAKKAKEKSDVKIYGRDVLASYKVIYSVILTPIVYTIYAIIICYFYGWRYSFLFLFSFPLLTYFSAKLTDDGLNEFRWFKAVLKIKWIGGEFTELINMRQSLINDVRELADEYGPKFIKNFDQERIVSKEQLKNENKFTKSNAFKVSNPEQEILTEEDWDSVTTTLFNDSTKRN